MARFSIIVPVYNAEAYLDDCLDSACGQTFEDLEVICINDGSTDSSRDILHARSMIDARIRVIDKANAGPSSARNDGIRIAQGDYLCFLDADDLLEPNALERIAQAFVEDPCDAVVFGWSYEPAGKADRFVREHVRVRNAYYPQFAPELLFKEMSNPYLRLAVRSDALQRSGVLFDEALRVGEDAQFLFALYPRIGGVKLISDKLYRYLLPHEGSIMADYADDVAHLCMSDLDAAISIFDDWDRGGLLEPYGADLVNWFVRSQLYTILRQPVEIREPLTAVVRDMWRAHFSNEELVSLELNDQTSRLVRIVISSSDDGELVVDEKELSHALFSWRLAEYGVLDLAVTAADRATSYLLQNRRMLLKRTDSQQGSADYDADEEVDLPADSAERNVQAAAASHDVPPVKQVAVRDAFDRYPSFDEEYVFQEDEGPVQPVVSVIVPVYNVEKYLDQALNSIRSQTLRALEIICVNDGSTDSSFEIMNNHASQDARIRVIDKPNGGYGSACNCGISLARGTWIAIVEPDDWIDARMYESMTSFAAGLDAVVDVVKTPYWRIWMPDTDEQRRVNCSYRGRVRPASQPFKLTDPGVTHLIIHHPSIWSALYRREFIQEHEIRFMEIPGAGWADNPFMVETLCQAKAIAYLDEPFYNYREETPEKTEQVAKTQWKVSLDRWLDMADVYERLGVTDENILRAHIRRGFTYIGLVVEYHDLDAEDDVRTSIKSVFDRMDDALVFSEDNISPGSKKLYAEIKGVELPKTSPLPYAAQIVKGGLYNIVNTGPAMTLDTMKGFIGSHAKREGK